MITFSIKKLIIMMFDIITFSIMTFSIITQHHNKNAIVGMICPTWQIYAGCRYAEFLLIFIIILGWL